MVTEEEEEEEEEERKQMRQDLSCLSPPDSSPNNNVASNTHHEGTATWFFQGSIFEESRSTPSDINAEAHKKEEGEGREACRRGQEKQQFDGVVHPVHLLRVRCPVCFSCMSMI